MPQFLPALYQTLQAQDLLPQANTVPDEPQILARLTDAIAALLQNNPQQLPHIAYRLDLSERSFREALNSPGAAGHIAALICRRQYEKWLSRQQNPPPPAAPTDDDLRW